MIGTLFKIFLIGAAIIMVIVGCAPDYIETPKAVDVPVGVPCKVDQPKMPVWATVGVNEKSGMFVQAQALVAADKQHQGFEVAQATAISSCQ